MLDATDKRQKSRRPTVRRGTIVYNRGASSAECIIRDLSSRGARLEVASVAGIPDSFFLTLPDAAGTQPCRVAWRRIKEMGVAFQPV